MGKENEKMDVKFEPYSKGEITEAKNVLVNSLDLLLKYGWCKFVMEDDFGSHCILGAIYNWKNKKGCEHDFHKDAARSIFIQVNNITSIPVWNDHPSRTKKQVITAFKKAIAYCDKLLKDKPITVEMTCVLKFKKMKREPLPQSEMCAK
jgi:hypothetical protein